MSQASGQSMGDQWEMAASHDVRVPDTTSVVPEAERWSKVCKITAQKLNLSNPPVVLYIFPPESVNGLPARGPCKYVRTLHPLDDTNVLIYTHVGYQQPALFFRRSPLVALQVDVLIDDDQVYATVSVKYLSGEELMSWTTAARTRTTVAWARRLCKKALPVKRFGNQPVVKLIGPHGEYTDRMLWEPIIAKRGFKRTLTGEIKEADAAV